MLFVFCLSTKRDEQGRSSLSLALNEPNGGRPAPSLGAASGSELFLLPVPRHKVLFGARVIQRNVPRPDRRPLPQCSKAPQNGVWESPLRNLGQDGEKTWASWRPCGAFWGGGAVRDLVIVPEYLARELTCSSRWYLRILWTGLSR